MASDTTEYNNYYSKRLCDSVRWAPISWMHAVKDGVGLMGCVTKPQHVIKASALCVRLGLTDVAGVSVVAGSIVPLPVENPEHLDAVFVAFSIVRFVEIPVGVRRSLVVRRPFPTRQTRAVSGKTDPEVAVTGFYKKRRNSTENSKIRFIKIMEAQSKSRLYSVTGTLSGFSPISRFCEVERHKPWSKLAFN